MLNVVFNKEKNTEKWKYLVVYKWQNLHFDLHSL